MPTTMSGEEALEFGRAQTAVLAALNTPNNDERLAAQDALTEFKLRGVPEHIVHELLINTWLHLDYAGRRLETLTSGKKIAEREVLKLRETGRVLHKFNVAALETLRRDISDATLVPAEAFIGAGELLDYFKGYPDAAADVRAALGYPPERIRGLERATRRGAFGRFAYVLRSMVSDHQSHDQRVADLLKPIFFVGDAEEVRRCLIDYERRLSV
jgi:hypothetical protein